MQSDAVQPCKLYFGELGIGGWAGMAAGGGEDETLKKGVKSEKSQQAMKRSVGGWNQLPPPRIRRCPAMSGRLSLYAGVEAPERVEPSSEAARRKARERERERAPRSMCCPFIGVFVHAQSMSAYVQFVSCVLPA